MRYHTLTLSQVQGGFAINQMLPPIRRVPRKPPAAVTATSAPRFGNTPWPKKHIVCPHPFVVQEINELISNERCYEELRQRMHTVRWRTRKSMTLTWEDNSFHKTMA